MGDSRKRRSREPTPSWKVPLWAGGKKSLAHKTGQKKIRMWVGTEKLRKGRETLSHGSSLSRRQARRSSSAERDEGRDSRWRKDEALEGPEQVHTVDD